MALIKLRDICKEYSKDEAVTKALININLEIEKGEFIAIIGASGSGKTSLLNIIGCMDKASSGVNYFNDELLSEKKGNELSKIRAKRISFVFQNFALLNNYTVFENIEIPLLNLDITLKERTKRILEAMESLGISSLKKKKTCDLSGGQKQRVAIARAIVCGSEVILADEPTGSLDSVTAKEIMKVFKDLNDKGITIVLITHEEKIASCAKRIIEIKDGRIVSDEKNC